MNDSKYTYSPIDLSTDAIRLLRLSGGSDGEPLHCDLFQTFLSSNQADGVPYEALSYAWGDVDSELFEIYICGKKAMVRENLYLALGSLRQPDRERILWIDAICIDQDNPKERGHQVGQMRTIYEMAEQVVVWLGRSTEDIDRLMKIITKLDQRATRRVDYRRVTSTAWEKEWPILLQELGFIWTSSNMRCRDGLNDLLQRPWFHRVWILQEVFNARNAVIQCGRMTVPSRAFVVIPSLMAADVSEHTQAVLDIMPGCLRTKKDSWWGQRPELMTLLQRFQMSEASDPRDKIYALLGIASNTGSRDAPQPNYEVTLQETIHQSISFLIFGQASTDFRLELPDWNLNELLANLDQLAGSVLDWALRHKLEQTATEIVSRSNIDINQCLPVIKTTPLVFLANQRGFSSTYTAILSRRDVDVNSCGGLSYPGAVTGASPLSIDNATQDWEDFAQLGRLLNKKLDLMLSYENGRSGETALFVASKMGHLELVKLLLERGAHVTAGVPSLSHAPQYAPIYAAASNGHTEIVELLLEYKATFSGALWIAAAKNHVEVVETILRKIGALAASKEIGGWRPSALWISCYYGHEHVVRMLVDAGASVDTKASHRMPEYSIPQELEFNSSTRDLVDLEMRESARQVSNVTALGISMRNGHKEVTKILLQAGADPNLEMEKEGVRPLYMACQKGDIDMARILLAKGAKAYRNMLLVSCSSGRLEMVHELLAAGVDIDVRNHNGESALIISFRSNPPEMVRELLTAGANINSQDYNGDSALMRHCRYSRPEMVHQLLAAGVDINAQNNFGESALIIACSSNQPEMVRKLLAAGADINAQDRHGQSALIIACKSNRPGVVRVLLGHGATGKSRDRICHEPAPCVACHDSDAEVSRLLLNRGAQVNCKDNNGRTALWISCYYGYTYLVRMLIRAGADINTQDSDGRSAIWTACMHNHEDVVRTLIQEGAAIRAKKYGYSALWVSCREGHAKLVRMLIDAGCMGSTINREAAPTGETQSNRSLAPSQSNTAIQKAPMSDQYLPYLWISLRNRERDVVRVLIEKGADVPARNWELEQYEFEIIAQKHEYREFAAIFTEKMLAEKRGFSGERKRKAADGLEPEAKNMRLE